MYNTNAVLQSFSLIGFMPTVSVPSRYQIEIMAATLICWEEGPSPPQTSLYADGSIPIRPNDQRRVGMYMPAPWRSVTTEIIAAAPKPKVTRGKLECVYAFSFLATYRFAKNTTPTKNNGCAIRGG